LAIISPIVASPLAEIVPTWAISSEDLTFLARFLMSFDDRGDGDVDAALEVHRVHAGGDRLRALAHDRLGEHGRGRGAVAGDVVGLRGDFAHHLGAHVLELVGELDLLGDGDAVLGDARRAEGLVDDDVAALGAERDLDRVGEDVDAAQHALAGIGGEFYVFGSHFCLLWWFEMEFRRRSGRRRPSWRLADHCLDDAHDVGLLHDQEVLAVDLDLGAGPLAEQDAVAGLDVERDELAALVAGAGADGDDLAFLRLLLGGVGNDDAAPAGAAGVGWKSAVSTLPLRVLTGAAEIRARGGRCQGSLGADESSRVMPALGRASTKHDANNWGLSHPCDRRRARYLAIATGESGMPREASIMRGAAPRRARAAILGFVDRLRPALVRNESSEFRKHPHDFVRLDCRTLRLRS
jgi:hypothetical protein